MKKSEQYKMTFLDGSSPLYFGTKGDASNYYSTTAFSLEWRLYSPKDENGNRELIAQHIYE